VSLFSTGRRTASSISINEPPWTPFPHGQANRPAQAASTEAARCCLQTQASFDLSMAKVPSHPPHTGMSSSMVDNQGFFIQDQGLFVPFAIQSEEALS